MPVYGPSMPVFALVASGLDPTGTNDSTAALNAALALSKMVIVPPGTYKFTGQIIHPANTVCHFAEGVTLNVAYSIGSDWWTIDNGGRVRGDGLIAVNTLNGSNMARVFCNKTRDGTQSYCWVGDVIITNNTGSTVSVASIDFQGVFVNSGISNCVVNRNNNANAGPAIRVAGSTTAGVGFGPVFIDNCWVAGGSGNNNASSNVVITETLGGACTFWITNLTSEHQSQGVHGLHFIGTGGLSGRISGYHWENGNTATSGVTAGIYIDGAGNFIIDDYDVLVANNAFKWCMYITNNSVNVRIHLRTLRNNSNLNNVITDLTGLGYTLAGVGHVGEWSGPVGANPPQRYGSVSLNNDLRRSIQTVAYAAAITIDPRAGETVKIGTLTGDITINQPWSTGSFAGQELTLQFTHSNDATVRTITWNAVFKKAGGAFPNTNTALAVDSITFWFDGTNWREKSRALNIS